MAQYNSLLPNIKTIINKHLLVLHNSHEMPQISPKNTATVTFSRNKNLKEFIPPYLFPRATKENNYSIEKCNRRYDLCKNFLEVSTEFICHATKRKYK